MSKFSKILIILIVILLIEILLIYRGYKIKKTNTEPLIDKPVFALINTYETKIRL
jgi:hypothetical protein